MSGLTAAQRDEIRHHRSEEARRRLREAIELEPDIESRTPVKVIDVGIILSIASAGLTEDEREVWVDRNVVGRTLQAVANSMGFSRTWVRKLERAADEKIAAVYPYFVDDSALAA